MAPISYDSGRRENGEEEVNKWCSLCFKTMKSLSEVGMKEIPRRFIFHEDKRPNNNSTISTQLHMSTKKNNFR